MHFMPLTISAIYSVKPQEACCVPLKDAVGWWLHVCMYFGVGIKVH